MKLLTFLGVGRYNKTTYFLGNMEWECSFSPVASCHFLNPESLTVFLTEEAEAKVFPQLIAELPARLQVDTVPVPLGGNTDELWQIFSRVVSSVPVEEEVAFDITHGLRSFPLVGLLAAAFLKSALNINLRAVHYGAYDVGMITSPGKTPVFDLTPLLSLLEWSSAADRFNRTGDSRYLASLVNSQRKSLAQAAGDDHGLMEEVGRLGKLASALVDISQSLHLIRPYSAMEGIADLSERVEKARKALERSASAQPFNVVLQSILDTYSPLAHPHPEDPDQLLETLRVERCMIYWYIERELWVQAVSLAREWLVSWVMVQQGNRNITQLDARRITETVLGSESSAFVKSKVNGQPYQPAFLASIPRVEAVLALWPNLTEVRNDIDHAGKREDPGTPKKLIEQIKTLFTALEKLPLEKSTP